MKVIECLIFYVISSVICIIVTKCAYSLGVISNDEILRGCLCLSILPVINLIVLAMVIVTFASTCLALSLGLVVELLMRL